MASPLLTAGYLPSPTKFIEDLLQKRYTKTVKTIVTHIGPDLDAICAVWLVKTFYPEWEEAALAFVPAGTTLGKKSPDDDPEIIHVDTGLGKFDHHQSNSDTCAAMLVYEEIKSTQGEDVALARFVKVVNDIDHFREVNWPNPTADYWELLVTGAIDGWRLMYPDDWLKVVANGMEMLDGVYKTLQAKVWAEKEIEEHGVQFETKWGKGLAIESVNDEVVHLGQKMGYALVVRKDSRKGYLRIKSLPKEEIDLEQVYDRLKKDEPSATWFLHASHHMVLNGSSKNPDFRPSQKKLEEVIEVLKTA